MSVRLREGGSTVVRQKEVVTNYLYNNLRVNFFGNIEIGDHLVTSWPTKSAPVLTRRTLLRFRYGA